MEIRPYGDADRDACLAILDSTSVADQRPQFEKFLQAPEGPFYVMEHDRDVIGCGGYTVSAQGGPATLVWGMIRGDMQKQGLGRFLLMYRLREIGKLQGIEQVRVEVSPNTARFFGHQGFKTASGEGERIEMVKRLTVCQ